MTTAPADLYNAIRRPRVKKDRLGIHDWVFLGLMFTLNFEYIWVYMYGFDTIWKPYRIITIVGVLLALPKFKWLWHRHHSLISPLLLSVGTAVGLSIALVVIGEADYDSVIDALMLLGIGLGIMLCTAIVSMRAIRIGMVIFISTILINFVYALLVNESEYFRTSGFFRNPNHFGAAIAVACLYVVSIYNQRHRLLMLSALVLLLLGMFLTGSRSTLGAVFIIMLMSVIIDRRARAAIVILFFIGMVGYIFYSSELLGWLNSFQDGRLADRFSVSEIVRASYRKELGMAAINLGLETGFIGVGIHQFSNTHYYDLVNSLNFFYDKYGHAVSIHNFYLSLLVEWGFIAFIFMSVFVVRALKITSKSKDDMGRFVNRMIWLFVFVAATADLTQYVHFWMAIGLMMAIFRERYVWPTKKKTVLWRQRY